MPHELQYSAAGRKQGRVRRTSGLSGRALKQQVELIAWGALIAMQAKPVRAGNFRARTAQQRNGELMAPQPKPDDLKDHEKLLITDQRSQVLQVPQQTAGFKP